MLDIDITSPSGQALAQQKIKSERKHRKKSSKHHKKVMDPEAAHIEKRYNDGLLTPFEELTIAPTGPTGSYEQGYYAADGEYVEFAGAYVPLYCTPEILKVEFKSFLGKDSAQDIKDSLIMSGAGNISLEDMIRHMAKKKVGRQALAKYSEPSDIFLKDRTLKPFVVKDYYILAEGLAGTVSGLTATLKSKGSVGEARTAGFISALAAAVRGPAVAGPGA